MLGSKDISVANVMKRDFGVNVEIIILFNVCYTLMPQIRFLVLLNYKHFFTVFDI